MSLPTAAELRAELERDTRPYTATLQRVKVALADRALAHQQINSAASAAGRRVHASEKRDQDAHATELAKLSALANELEQLQPLDPNDRKLKFGVDPKYAHRYGGAAQLDYRRAETLSADHSVLEWVKARDTTARGLSDTAMTGAWNALARGLMVDDWDEWQLTYKPQFRLDMSGGGEGGELIPAPLAGNVIDLMRSNTPIFQAGATTVPMSARTLDIARVTADPTATAWHAENAAITPDTAMTLDTVTFTAKTLPVIVKASMELSEDAPNLGEVVRRAIAGAIGVELTRAALRGDGTSNSPTGIRNATGVEAFAIGVDGGAVTIDMLIDRVTAIREENIEPNAIIWHPRTSGGVTKLAKDSNGVYFALPSPLAELGRFTTTAIPKDLTKGTGTDLTEVYFGQWSQLLVGMRTNMRIRVLDQRYADTGTMAFMAWLRADIQLAHGEAFSVITDTTT